MSDDELVDDPTIPDKAVLWRRVHYENYVVDENEGRLRRRPTSHAFRDSKDGSPMSVFLADEFDEPDEVLEDHDGWGLVSITAGLARKCGQLVVRDRAPDAPRGHAYVVGDKRKKTVRQCLATQAEEVVSPSPPPLGTCQPS